MDIQSHTELTELTDIISLDASLSVISVASVCPFSDPLIIRVHQWHLCDLTSVYERRSAKFRR